MVRSKNAGAEVFDARRVHSVAVADECRHPGFVQRCPAGYPVPERSGNYARIVLESLSGVPTCPAASVLKALGKVPVVKRDDRLDVSGTQCVH